MLMTFVLASVIGLLLGLLGGGGSILTVPMLVYWLHVEPKLAILTSFIVVGSSSLVALIPHARRGSVCWKSGLWFGLAGMLGAFVAGRLAGQFAADWLMCLFALVSLATGLLMLSGKREMPPMRSKQAAARVCPSQVALPKVLFDGFLVGALTGMVGVGGGFLIVPALTLLIGLPMQGAVGTSLLIIVMNALAGLIGFSGHVALDLDLTMIVGLGTLAGSMLGAWGSVYIKPIALRQAFGLMVVLTGIYVLSRALSPQLLDGIEQVLFDAESLGKSAVALLMLLLLIRIGQRLHKADVTTLSSH